MKNRGLEISLMSTEVSFLLYHLYNLFVSLFQTCICYFDIIFLIIAIENDSLVRTVWSIVTEARTFF